MYVNKISVRNFRVLSNSTLDFKDNLCLLIGRNNSGKTSFLVLLEKFLSSGTFDFNDFSLCKRKKILEIGNDSIETELSIQLILNIEYEEDDDLSNLSEFIMDLDPVRREVNILFECSIEKDKLLEAIKIAKNIPKEKYVHKYLNDFLVKNVYIFNDIEDLKIENRYRLVKKDFKDVKKLIDFEIIHAKRSVSSSEEKNGKKVLSELATNYFNTINRNEPDKFEEINELIENMDTNLGDNYATFFDEFLGNAKDFLNLESLKIVSNLKAQEILTDSSEVIYGVEKEQLPEYLNGLGHMNILYLLLNMEIKKNNFISNNKDIKLLFIEEPEAHTHPQLQYIFARKVSELVNSMHGVQTIITTHSSHIVANHPFKNIRYMLAEKDKCNYTNISIKNFYEDLRNEYSNEEEEFQFLKQYLTIESADLFFADKVIFIEGISENMLLPYFISRYDSVELDKEKKYLESNPEEKPSYIPIASQNVSILQVGANAKVFKHFLEFLKIPALIITDIDTTKKNVSNYYSCAVQDSPNNISNSTIKYYLKAPDLKEVAKFKIWLKKLVENKLECSNNYVYIAYQKNENNYHARSFEDAFINVNLSYLKSECANINGLKNRKKFCEESCIYKLTNEVIDNKSDFASSLLFKAHVNKLKWEIPSYIWEGLKWLQRN
ncbi:AAA family ATPase [Listeria rocourtiae]|uniref:ATP-dependent nuclease n=1 Tax=Listeria rocourtiae TaxID=647910 RepID=UPI0016289FB4|nr:ATP-dependent endonuclease [Listeria rocourtiae]MBC1606031.1 AAA family ATPase [Listeria rocourtiae]